MIKLKGTLIILLYSLIPLLLLKFFIPISSIKKEYISIYLLGCAFSLNAIVLKEYVRGNYFISLFVSIYVLFGTIISSIFNCTILISILREGPFDVDLYTRSAYILLFVSIMFILSVDMIKVSPPEEYNINIDKTRETLVLYNYSPVIYNYYITMRWFLLPFSISSMFTLFIYILSTYENKFLNHVNMFGVLFTLFFLLKEKHQQLTHKK